MSEAAAQFLTFILAGTEYGVDILRVQEIKGWEAVTPLPNMPDHILGVMNLRGNIIPVVDLRRRFGLEAQVPGPTTVVIVLRVEDAERSRVVGIVADAVSDVIQLEAAAIKPAPELGGSVTAEVVRGLATVGDKMVILLQVDDLLEAGRLALAGTATE